MLFNLNKCRRNSSHINDTVFCGKGNVKMENRISEIFGIFLQYVNHTPSEFFVFSEEGSLTYKEAWNYVCHLAEEITRATKGEKQRIVLKLNHSYRIVLAILAVFKTGSSYVPTRVELCEEEFVNVLHVCKSKVVICDQEEHIDDATVIALDNISMEEVSTDTAYCKYAPEDEVYVMFTSGSTGMPKGCSICYRNLLYIINNMIAIVDKQNDTVFCFSTPYTFDVSTTEIFSFAYGAKIFVCNTAEYKCFKSFPNLVAKYRVTHLALSPSSMKNMINSYDCSQWSLLNKHLQMVMVAGEAFKPEIFQKWEERNWQFSLINLYGPTEATVYATKFELKSGMVFPNGIPIGTCLNGCGFVVENPDEEGIGELVLVGEGISNGYVNSELETKQRFYSISGRKAYRTGDLVKEENGLLYYHGRNDRQVQINGIRVELGEIENRIKQLAFIDDAVVLYHVGVLIATIKLSKNNQKVTPMYIKEVLRGSMPQYMVPNVVRIADSFPLSPNKKIDYNCMLNEFLLEDNTTKRFPRTGLEEEIVEIMQECLEDRPFSIGKDDDFFEKGGDSLSAVQLASRLEHKYEVSFGIDRVYLLKSASRIAMYLSTAVMIDSLPGKELKETNEEKDFFDKLAQLTKSIKDYLYKMPYDMVQKYSALFTPRDYYEGNANLVLSFSYNIGAIHSVDEVKAAIVKLIKYNPILHSKAHYEKGNLFLEEYMPPEENDLPELYLEKTDKNIIDYIIKNYANEVYYARYHHGFLATFVIVKLREDIQIVGLLDHIISDAFTISILKDNLGSILLGKEIAPFGEYKSFCQSVRGHNSDIDRIVSNWFVDLLKSSILDDRRALVEKFKLENSSLCIRYPERRTSTDTSVFLAYTVANLVQKYYPIDNAVVKILINLREVNKNLFGRTIGDLHITVPLVYTKGMSFSDFEKRSNSILDLYSKGLYSPADAQYSVSKEHRKMKEKLDYIFHNCSVLSVNYLGEYSPDELPCVEEKVIENHTYLQGVFKATITISAVSSGPDLHIFMGRNLLD